MYAQWTKAKYKVTYDWETDVPSDAVLPTDGNTYNWHDSVTKDGTYTNGSTSSAAKNGIPGTWIFSGWTANDKLTEDGVEGNVTFTGTWKFIPKTVPPVTGENNSLALWLVLLLSGSAALVIILFFRKKIITD